MVVDGGVPDFHQLLGLLLTGDANVDPHMVEFGDFLALLRAHEMDGPLAGDAFDDAVFRHDIDTSAR